MYKGIIKRKISHEEYEKHTGIVLSDQDKTGTTCVSIEEKILDTKDRRDAFKLLFSLITPITSPVSMTVLPMGV